MLMLKKEMVVLEYDFKIDSLLMSILSENFKLIYLNTFDFKWDTDNSVDYIFMCLDRFELNVNWVIKKIIEMNNAFAKKSIFIAYNGASLYLINDYQSISKFIHIDKRNEVKSIIRHLVEFEKIINYAFSENEYDYTYNNFKHRFDQIVYDAINKNRKIVVKLLAKDIGISVSTLERETKKHYGKSPIAVIKEYRLKKAMRLLDEGATMSISELSKHVGFNSPSYFTKCFMGQFGHPPSYFKRQVSSVSFSS